MNKKILDELKNKINTRDAAKGFEGSAYSFSRSMEPVLTSVDEKQYLRMTLTSETPIEDWFGFLILDHSPGAIITDRLDNKSCSFRDEHWGDQIGYIDDYLINANRKLEIGVMFSPNNDRAVLLYKDYRDKYRRNTSARFVVHDLILETDKEGVQTYRATKWELIHGAAVPDGADPNVGTDRNLNKSNIKGVITMDEQTKTQDRTLSEAELEALKTKIKTDLSVEQKNAVDRAALEGGEKALANIAAIMQYRDMYKEELKDICDLAKLADDFAFKLKASERQFSDMIIGKLSEKKSAGTFDVPEKDRAKFSSSKLILSMANPSNKADHERDLCAAYAKERGITPNGILIPKEFLSDRTMTVAAPTGGGNLVGTAFLNNEFIPLNRNISLTDKLGIRRLPNLVGDVAIPTQSAATTGGWMTDESTGAATSDMTFGQTTMSPQTYHDLTGFSRKLLIQGLPQIDQLVNDDIQKVANLAIDKVVFHGRGHTTYGEPQGIYGTSGVGLNTIKTSWTFADMVAMETVIAMSNLEVNSSAYVTTPTIRGTLKTTLTDAGVSSPHLWTNNEVNGYKAFASNQITAGFIFFGDFSQVVVGEWGGIDVVVDAVSSNVGLITVKIFVSVDVALRYAAAFSNYRPS